MTDLQPPSFLPKRFQFAYLADTWRALRTASSMEVNVKRRAAVASGDIHIWVEFKGLTNHGEVSYMVYSSFSFLVIVP